jgi:short-subunit dehydrogenase
MRAKYGPWAVIAGASEGTGAQYARQLAAVGINVVLLSRRIEALDKLAAELRAQYKIETRTKAVDLKAPDAGEQIKAAAAGLEVGLYVSNAGADNSGSHFLDQPVEFWHQLVNMNVRTVIDAVHVFATAMKKRGKGGIVLMSSGAALGGQPRIAMYSGTKAFEVNFAESLWVELRASGVDVLGVAAPAMDTPMLREVLGSKGINPDSVGLYQPADVVRTALAYLPEGPTYVFPLDESEKVEELNAARKSRLLKVTEVTKAFFGSA